jgi:hypothetical protein
MYRNRFAIRLLYIESATRKSKLDSESQLSLPGTIAGVSHGAEAAIVRVSVRVPKYVAVECVEELSAELDINPLRNRYSLNQPEVFLVISEGPVVGLIRRLIAKTVGQVWSAVDAMTI